MKKIIAFAAALMLVLQCTAALATVLRPGDSGTAVMTVQRALNDQGWASIAVDGRYGSATVSAVKYFQIRNGLKADGKAGPRTLAKLLGTTSLDNNPEPDNKIRTGSYGTAVRNVQARLSSLGYPVGKVDGVYGAKTVRAVKMFQQLNGLRIDGVVGSDTVAALSSTAAVPYTPAVEMRFSTLRPGYTGNDVMKLQQDLTSLGYNCYGNTGYYNENTVNAVRTFQAAYGLKIDGIAGPNTLSTLYKLLGH